MATLTNNFFVNQPPPEITPTTSNYRNIYDYTDKWDPSLSQTLHRVRSRGSLQGFLDANSMTEGFSADKFYWAEEGERHVIHENVVARAGNVFTLADHKIRPGIKILVSDKANNVGAIARVSSTTATTFTAEPYGYADFDSIVGMGTASLTVLTAGSEFKKGANGQQVSLEMQVDLYDNKPIISGDTFQINNTDLTNVTWFQVDGNYYWYDEQFDETLRRFMDDQEVGLLTAEPTDAASSLSGEYEGTSGYFHTLRNRGNSVAGIITTTADWQAIIKTLDKVHGENSYYGYFSREQTMAVDNWLASLNALDASTGTNYGIFSNGKEMALELGFRGFSWSDYSFYKQTWNLLKDPTKFGSDELAAVDKVHGVLFPHGNMNVLENTIAGTPAARVNYLTLMHKEMPGYSRKMEQYFIGSGRIATPTTDGDYLKMVVRSECALRTVGARKQFIIGG